MKLEFSHVVIMLIIVATAMIFSNTQVFGQYLPTKTTTPVGLNATAISPTQINLSWFAPTETYGQTISGYKIERKLDSNTFITIVDNTGSRSTAYSVTGLEAGKTYTFIVSACFTNSCTNPSNEASTTTLPTPSPIPTPTPTPTQPLPSANYMQIKIAQGSSTTGCEQTSTCFIPFGLSVDVGSTVTWYNDDTASHTVTSGVPSVGPNGKFDSGLFAGGKTFSHKFTEAGTYKYFCQVHSWMTGVVDVRGASVTPSPPIADTIPPLIIVPSNMTIQATGASGAVVQYAVKGIDNVDGIISPICNPSSNSLFPVGNTVVSCSARDSSGNSAVRSFAVNVKAPSILIPNWIKNVAKFWCSGEIDDTGFAQAIQYLITNKIIVIPPTQSGTSTSQQIPAWLKNNACWWSSGLISDADFASGIQYLVEKGIIRV